jgi:hypothetical protein
MEKKRIRAQTTIFIIIALLIVAILIVFVLFRQSSSETVKVNPEIEPLYNFVKSCIEESAENAVYTIGQSGGYFILPDSTPINLSVPYYAYRGENRMLSKQELEEQLSLYIENLLPVCVLNFIYYPDFDVEQGDINVESGIQKDRVVFNVDYPLSIRKGESTFQIERFERTEIPVRLDTIYEVSKEITLEEIKHPKDICFSCMGEFAEREDLYISLVDYGEEDLIVTIRDENSKIRGQDYNFIFANKYEVENE